MLRRWNGMSQGIADILLDENQTAQVARPGTSLARPMTSAQGGGVSDGAMPASDMSLSQHCSGHLVSAKDQAHDMCPHWLLMCNGPCIFLATIRRTPAYNGTEGRSMQHAWHHAISSCPPFSPDHPRATDGWLSAHCVTTSTTVPIP